ncbi:hypothetical protein [Nocardia ignorata]|uniref:Tail assembly chaperone n=1 Tax=Nocardia ignorata TaxID=145285 RepID=A0A4R6NZJ1_NOCIG|nr:hypothetical protein [Nocardia ignorata]TDP29758.1 hypothetical protein DFR75_11219 [Nocardia ignorata]
MASKKTTAVTETAPMSRWAKMRADAEQAREKTEPYMFDGTNPPTPVHEPVTSEQVLAFAELIDKRGSVDPANLPRLIKAVLGDSYDAVWDVVRTVDANVILPLLEDINAHFHSLPTEAGDLPGGASAS